MPLPIIPREPEPTDEELRPYREKWPPRFSPDGKKIVHGARFFWKADEREKRPDDFQVAFPPDNIDYDAYLKSSLWKEIRERVLESADYRCLGCGKKATEVHHRDYRPKILRGEDLSLLVPLCRRCHKFIHTDANGKHENTWNETESRLIQLVAEREEGISNQEYRATKNKRKKKSIIQFE